MIQRRPELDGLRGLAALIVLIAHISNESALWNGLLGHGTGKVGLMIFFCLSGYLMGALYLQRRPNGQELLSYGLHRASRVLPLYLAVVAASFIFGVLTPYSPLYRVNDENLLEHLALVRASGVLWTIPVEIQFYLVFVGLWIVYSRSQLVFILLCANLIPVLWYVADDMNRIGWSLLAWAPYFLVGLLISRLPETRRRFQLPDWFWSVTFFVAVAATLLLFPQVALIVGGSEFADSVRLEPWHNRWSYLAAGLLVASAIRAPMARPLLANPAMVYVGTISYSVYLLHMPVIRLLNDLSPLEYAPVAFLLVATAATVFLASLSYFYFEDPVRKRLNANALRVAPRRAQISESV